jgi:hypothetical protein
VPPLAAGEPITRSAWARTSRVRNDDGVPLAALANGFRSAFDVCAPSASRLLLDLFFAEWAASSGPVQDRLGIAFEAARERFLAEAQGLVEPDIDFPDTRPAGVLLAVAIDGATAHAAWIGGDEAILARGGLVAGASMPHTLLRQLDPEARAISPTS